MRAPVKADGTHYYEYVLCYVDDVLASSVKPQAIMDSLSGTFTLKDYRLCQIPSLICRDNGIVDAVLEGRLHS